MFVDRVSVRNLKGWSDQALPLGKINVFTGQQSIVHSMFLMTLRRAIYLHNRLPAGSQGEALAIYRMDTAFAFSIPDYRANMDEEVFSIWMKRLGIFDRVYMDYHEHFNEVIGVDAQGNTVMEDDFPLAVRHALTTIDSCIMASKGNVVYLDCPEAGLSRNRSASVIADMIVFFAAQHPDAQFLIETHSPEILARFERLLTLPAVIEPQIDASRFITMYQARNNDSVCSYEPVVIKSDGSVIRGDMYLTSATEDLNVVGLASIERGMGKLSESGWLFDLNSREQRENELYEK